MESAESRPNNSEKMETTVSKNLTEKRMFGNKTIKRAKMKQSLKPYHYPLDKSERIPVKRYRMDKEESFFRSLG